MSRFSLMHIQCLHQAQNQRRMSTWILRVNQKEGCSLHPTETRSPWKAKWYLVPSTYHSRLSKQADWQVETIGYFGRTRNLKPDNQSSFMSNASFLLQSIPRNMLRISLRDICSQDLKEFGIQIKALKATSLQQLKSINPLLKTPHWDWLPDQLLLPRGHWRMAAVGNPWVRKL